MISIRRASEARPSAQIRNSLMITMSRLTAKRYARDHACQVVALTQCGRAA
jgi:hypothetical protein